MITSAVLESKKFKRVVASTPKSRGETFTDTLTRLLEDGNSQALNSLVVFQDEGVEISFKDDLWDFLASNLDFDGGSANLNFDIASEAHGHSNVLLLNDSQQEIKYQLKAFALTSIYLSPNRIQLLSLRAKLNELKKMVPILLKNGVYDFTMLTDEKLDEMCDEAPNLFKTRSQLEGLNALLEQLPWLPFELNYSRLKASNYSANWKAPNQYAVVPLKQYFDLMNWGKGRVRYYKSISSQIEEAVEKLLKFEDDELSRAIKGIRNGERKLAIPLSKKAEKFIDDLGRNGIDLVDYEKNPVWIEIFKKSGLKIPINKDRLNAFNVIVDGKSYGIPELKDLLREVAGTCGFVCLQLSGMRVDELYGAHVDFGAQKLTLMGSNKNSKSESKSKQKQQQREVIYLLTTRQSKIKIGTQNKKDTFVTTEDGYDAFNVLSSIFRSFNKRFEGKNKRRMWAGFRSCQSVKPCGKSTITNYINCAVKDLSGVSLSLTSDDLVYLNASDPSKELSVGDEFPFSPHTLRRSLAYYLAGYELCSFPALKQQFSHLSIAMTRWYARNSSHFSKVYEEVNKERTEQLADIYVRIYNKLANGERVAGGKGKQAAKEISRQGESYFEDGANKNLLSREYWVEQLKNDVKHLHVIAPGMVCTNKLCSMRINIDLSECVDCEFDYIEDVAFAESSRMDAMRNLNLLHERGELNHSSLSKFVMTIRSAEKIMDDLQFNYEPYSLSDELSEMLIQTQAEPL